MSRNLANGESNSFAAVSTSRAQLGRCPTFPIWKQVDPVDSSLNVLMYCLMTQNGFGSQLQNEMAYLALPLHLPMKVKEEAL